MSQIPPREQRWIPPSPQEQEALAQEAQRARAEREAHKAELLPLREAALLSGPELRDLQAALECGCSCHPSPGDLRLHERGAGCACQLTPEERRASWEALLAMPSPLTGMFESFVEEVARAAEAAGAQLRVACPAAPMVLAGEVEGRGCFLRERHGSFRVEVAPDENPTLDVWNAEPSEPTLVVAEGSEEELMPREGQSSGARAVEVLVEAVSCFLRQRSCAHPGMKRFCPECGISANTPGS